MQIYHLLSGQNHENEAIMAANALVGYKGNAPFLGYKVPSLLKSKKTLFFFFTGCSFS